MQSIAQILASELGQPVQYVENVIALLDEGSTIPFIARYRKEQHGSMDDTTLRKLEDRLQYLRNLDKRRQEVKSAIDGQGKLTDALAAAIDSAATLAEVEDLYRPYKQKRRTRATVAREKGLEPLAQLLLAQEKDCPAPEAAAQAYIDPEKGVETAADALQGANDIIAEIISDDADIRKALRSLLMRQGRLRSLAATEEDSVYRLYYDFEQAIPKLAGHQILAINRGEKEGLLSVTVLLDREAALPALRRAVVKPGSAAMEFIKAACEDAYDRLLFPSLEREARGQLSDDAYEGAIGQFALNLRPLLMQPPVKGKVTMGLDPGYRRLFVDYLRDYARSEGKTVFLTSHIIQDMERLVDDCIIMDYGKILIQKPIVELLEKGRRYTFTIPEGYELPASDDFYHPSVMRNQLETFSFLQPTETEAKLKSMSVPYTNFHSEQVNLEDAFIGLTGKY